MAGQGMPPPPPPAPMPQPFNNFPHPQHPQHRGSMNHDLFDPPIGEFRGMNFGEMGPPPNRGGPHGFQQPVQTSHLGFTLRKDPSPPNGGEPKWSCILKNPINVDSEELAQMVKERQAKNSVSKQYDNLRSSNQRYQIDRLVEEHKQAERHPDAKWLLASIKDVRGRSENKRIESESKELQVILKRQSKNASSAGKDKQTVKPKKGANGKEQTEKKAPKVIYPGERVDLNLAPMNEKGGRDPPPKGPPAGKGNPGNLGQPFVAPIGGGGLMGGGSAGGNQHSQHPSPGAPPPFPKPNFPPGPSPAHNGPPKQNMQPQHNVEVVPDFDDDFNEPVQIVRGSSPPAGPQPMAGRPPQNRAQPVHNPHRPPQVHHNMQQPAPQKPQPQQPYPHLQQPPPRPQFRKQPDFGEFAAPEAPQRMFEKGPSNFGKKPKPGPIIVDQPLSSEEDSYGGSSQFSRESADFSSPISSPLTDSVPGGRAHGGIDYLTGKREKHYRKHQPHRSSEDSFDFMADVIPNRNSGRRASDRRQRELAIYKPRERLNRRERLDKEILETLEAKHREEELRHLEALRDEERYESYRRDRNRRDSRRGSLDYGGRRSPTSLRKSGRRGSRYDDYF